MRLFNHYFLRWTAWAIIADLVNNGQTRFALELKLSAPHEMRLRILPCFSQVASRAR